MTRLSSVAAMRTRNVACQKEKTDAAEAPLFEDRVRKDRPKNMSGFKV